MMIKTRVTRARIIMIINRDPRTMAFDMEPNKIEIIRIGFQYFIFRP